MENHVGYQLDEYNYDSETDVELDEDNRVDDLVGSDEIEFMDRDRVDSQYYIGLCKPMENVEYLSKIWLFISVISPNSILRHDISDCLRWLNMLSLVKIEPEFQKIEIMKLCMIQSPNAQPAYAPPIYAVVKKTFWLRIVQRRWKRILKERKQFVEHFSNPNSFTKIPELGRFSNSLYNRRMIHSQTKTNIPQLRGMLSDLSVKC